MRQPAAKSALPFIASLAIHAAIGGVLVFGAPMLDLARGSKIIDLAINEQKREAPKPPPPKPVQPRKAASKEPRVKSPAPSPPPQPAAAKPPPAETTTKKIFGLSMASVVSGEAAGGSAVAIPVGNTLMTKPDGQPVPAAEVKPLALAPAAPRKAFDPVPAYKLNRQPKPKNLVKAPYPAEALVRGISGRVRLEVGIDEQGRVKWVKVLDGPGFGLNEAARAALLAMEFEPAIADDRPVATVITFIYNWELTD